MEKKFVCKYCFKRYPCGKSLGGHIRTHITQQRTTTTTTHSHIHNFDSAASITHDSHQTVVDVHADSANGNGNPVYGLRENPKKTLRFVHTHNHQHHHATAATLEQQQQHHEMIKFCKECGKGFHSLKALCGHMASHSDKDKKINYKEKLFIAEDDDDDNDDDTTQSDDVVNIRKSKKRIRFKSLTFSNQPSSSVNNDSVSEVEQEQQEVAMCLILLSRDSFSHKGRFVSESSDNNSVVLETKPRVTNNIVIRNGNKFVVDEKNKKKVKSIGIDVSNNSDLRDFSYGSSKIKIVDSNVSNYEFKKRVKVEQDHKSGFEKCRRKYNVKTMKDLDRDVKFDSRKKVNNEGIGFSNKNELYENGRKDLKYEYLGSEKNNDGNSYDSTTDDDDDDDESDEEISSESDSFPAAKTHNSKTVNRKKKASNKKKLKSKKSKEYECPICYKIFRSGQALGGHKRSHFVGGSEQNTFVIKQSNVPCFIDLNLPAPVDE